MYATAAEKPEEDSVFGEWRSSDLISCGMNSLIIMMMMMMVVVRVSVSTV